MAQVRVMYWKEIPVQVQAQDGDDSVSMPLDPGFQEAVDSIAMFDGSAGSDDYLDGWDWGQYKEVGGAQMRRRVRRRTATTPGCLPILWRD